MANGKNPGARPPSSEVEIAVPVRAFVGLALGVALAAGVVWFHRDGLISGPRNDFLAFYSAARLDGGKLYDRAALLRSEREIAGEDVSLPAPARTPLQAALLSPLTYLPYPAAWAMWLILGLWAAVGFIAFWRPPGPSWTLLLTAISAPLLLAFLRGQESAMLLFAAALATREVRRERPFTAGLALSLCAIEIHLFFLLPVLVAARRCRRLAQGALSGLAAAAAVSFAFAGAQWPRAYWEAASRAVTEPQAMPNLAGILAYEPNAALIEAAAGVALAMLVWITARRAPFPLALGVALAASLLVSHNAVPLDAVMLLPGALAAFAYGRSWLTRTVAVLVMTPVPFLWGLFFSMTPLVGLALLLLGLLLFESLRSLQPIAEAGAARAEPSPLEAVRGT